MAEVVWGVDDPTTLGYFSRGGDNTIEDLADGTLAERSKGPAQL